MTGYKSKKAAAQAKVTDDEPVAWRWNFQGQWIYSDVDPKTWNDPWPYNEQPLYTGPQQKSERYFCERCGKRLFDGIHTCTPPADTLQENT